MFVFHNFPESVSQALSGGYRAGCWSRAEFFGGMISCSGYIYGLVARSYASWLYESRSRGSSGE